AIRSELDDVERSDAVGSDAAQFAVEIGLARIERRHGLGDRRVFMGPVQPGARQQLNRAAVKPRMHAVAVVFEFMQAAVAVRRRVDQLRQLRRDPLRQRGRVGAFLTRYGARHELERVTGRWMRLLKVVAQTKMTVLLPAASGASENAELGA